MKKRINITIDEYRLGCIDYIADKFGFDRSRMIDFAIVEFIDMLSKGDYGLIHEPIDFEDMYDSVYGKFNN